MHDFNIIDKEPHFIIDATTRKITNELASEIAIVQFDHNSEVFTFELPRYIEAHDMTECNRVEVHYKNTDASTSAEVLGVYEVDDLQPDSEDENKAVCTWLISQNATQKVGKLDFLVRFSRVAEDGTILYAWNTSIFTGIMVSAGLMNSREIVEQYADVLEQWRQELFSLSAEGVENINTAKEDALADIEAVSVNLPSLSNALKGNKISQGVTITDISPVEHTVEVKVKSKNIASAVTYKDASANGIAVTVSMNIKKEKLYTISFDTKNTGATLWIALKTDYRIPVSGQSVSKKCDGTKQTFVFQAIDDLSLSNANLVQVSSSSPVGVETGDIYNLMVEEGTVATDYTKYVTDLTHRGIGVRRGENFEEFFANADGVIDGVTSYYPSLEIFAIDNTGTTTNDIVADITYNRDINKAFAELQTLMTNAVISLGGNV